jgi:hypothetical protein
MSKAKKEERQPHGVLPDVDLGPAIDQFRAIATQSGDALFTEGSVNPDQRLLDLCAEIGYHRKIAKAAEERQRAGWVPLFQRETPDDIASHAALKKESVDADRAVSYLLREVSKIKATTAAGIYAKAVAVRSSKTGSALLGVSLAQDLLDCPGLRAILWPATEGE